MCCEDRMVVTRAIPTIAGENFKMDDWHFGHSASRRFGSGHPRELRKRVHPGGFDFEDEVNFKGQRNETLRQPSKSMIASNQKLERQAAMKQDTVLSMVALKVPTMDQGLVHPTPMM
ncbi:hypothetical protein CYMTET_10064 [Cymbomonas tetramitiformis]|uniref:Uncharacterized protein n=1 Tax=Cymbomonas tetramitiformis TaxID=36881 RepID=A0AAE0LED6_9CHLO|nr:hypothetical protein CYMTET_10064 [Cymbomonas tetramitiformis]